MADDLRMALTNLLRKAEMAGDVDFLRDGVRILGQTLMDLEVSQHLRAEKNERTPEHAGHRNWYRSRQWDTRVGTVELQVPRVRDGSFFPSLLEPRRRAERALVGDVQEAYIQGVSTRRVDELVKALGMTGTCWQRCRVHFMRNALSHVPRTSAMMVAATIRTVFAQPDAGSAREQWRRVADSFRCRFPRLAELMDEAEADVLAYVTFPVEHWRQIWSNNPLERLNKEIKRRTNVVGIFPNPDSIVRLVGSVLSEQHDEWQVSKRYFSAESLAKVTGKFEEIPLPLAAAR